MKRLLVSFALVPLIWVSALAGQGDVLTRLASITVSVSPSDVTLFAGESRGFVALVSGADDGSVNWGIDEENGGTITNLGLYTAPRIQGVYHVTATSKINPKKKAVATVTVLTYCDPPLAMRQR